MLELERARPGWRRWQAYTRAACWEEDYQAIMSTIDWEASSGSSYRSDMNSDPDLSKTADSGSSGYRQWPIHAVHEHREHYTSDDDIDLLEHEN